MITDQLCGPSAIMDPVCGSTVRPNYDYGPAVIMDQVSGPTVHILTPKHVLTQKLIFDPIESYGILLKRAGLS